MTVATRQSAVARVSGTVAQATVDRAQVALLGYALRIDAIAPLQRALLVCGPGDWFRFGLLFTPTSHDNTVCAETPI